LKALIIDDDPIVRMLASKMLEVKSYSVNSVADENALIEHLNSHKECPDLILLDLQIGEMSGPEAYKYLIDAYGNLKKIICMSSHASYEAEEIFPVLSSYIDFEKQFIQKPFSSSKLYELI
jgi:CheY-like chemotaxis protein